MTIQEKDSIIIKGEKHCLYTYPLKSYWTRKNPMPVFKYPKTSCWRGYIATWEISDNSLYLIDVIFKTATGEVGLNYIFPHNTGKIKADWYTGELQIPIGDPVHSDPSWDTIYDYDWFLSIKKGNVISQRYKANY
jgi:hypothetical protein